MNRSKKLYILLAVLTASCAATFALMRMEERKEQIKNSGEIILELPIESARSLSWDYSGETLSFHKEESWLYDGDENFPVSEEKINSLLAQFQALRASFVIEEAEDYGQYGLDDPVCTVRLSTEERDYEIQLGGYSKMDSQRYVSIGDGNVYLVQRDPLEAYSAVLSDMIAHDEIPVLDHVSQIQFTGAESYRITYQENSADSYSAGDVYFTRQNGGSLPLDTSKVESYLWSISSLNPTRYVSYCAAEEELRAYGLDAPALTITVDYTAEDEDGTEIEDTLVLHVSPDPEDVKAAEEAKDSDHEAEISAYVRINESQIIYEIAPGDYEQLAAASCDDLRHSEVIWADFSDVRQIDVTLEGTSYTLASEKDGDARTWRYGEEEVEISALQNSLEALTAEEFTSQRPTQKAEISLAVHLDSENFPVVRIDLYQYDGTRCLAAAGGESVSLVERAAVVSLIEAVHAIVLG